MPKDPRTPFTRDDLRTMPESDIIAYWKARQRAAREDGRPHYTTLVDPTNDAIVATID